MLSHQVRTLAHTIALLGLPIAAIGAQRSSSASPPNKVRLSAVITAFLVDSGVRTQGLPWTIGSDLPVRWAAAKPVTNPTDEERRAGVTRTREGTFTGTVGDSVALPMTIQLKGSALGLTGMFVDIPSMSVTFKDGSGFFVTREMVEKALIDEGLTFQPLKCSRAKEGASYGNLVDAVKAPGKTASGLWWAWDSPRQEMRLTLALLYRRADMAQVTCFEG